MFAELGRAPERAGCVARLESLRPLLLARQQQENSVDDLFTTLERRWDLGDLLR